MKLAIELKTTHFTPKHIVYQHDGFVIAMGLWDGSEVESLAMRWHPEDAVGYPSIRGKPQWFNLPKNFVIDTSSDGEVSIVITGTEILHSLDNWDEVYYRGNGACRQLRSDGLKQIVCTSRRDGSSFESIPSSIVLEPRDPSLLSELHKTHTGIWISSDGLSLMWTSFHMGNVLLCHYWSSDGRQDVQTIRNTLYSNLSPQGIFSGDEFVFIGFTDCSEIIPVKEGTLKQILQVFSPHLARVPKNERIGKYLNVYSPTVQYPNFYDDTCYSVRAIDIDCDLANAILNAILKR